MANEVIVHKGRRNVISVNLGYDVSADIITSEIRAAPTRSAPLLATWVVTFATDGTDGELTLTLDDAATETTEADRGYMDLKRLTGGEPVSVFDQPLEVVFRGTVTE